MIYLDRWKAISARISGLIEAANLHVGFLNVRSNDGGMRWRYLRAQCQSILTALEEFIASFAEVLPPSIKDAVEPFTENVGLTLRDTTGTNDAQQERVWGALVTLKALETEISFLFHDSQEIIRARCERAFVHLQRLIVVDEDYRNKWKAAFKSKELNCEKLGAVHLLWHGIWAFKVDGAGARTDLVFQEPTGDLLKEQRYADGFVLTEWKRSKAGSDAESSFITARGQAKKYAKGVLAGNELTNYRYAVVVSEKAIPILPDFIEDNIVYRHINIAVNPEVPSKG